MPSRGVWGIESGSRAAPLSSPQGQALMQMLAQADTTV
jgi:hypothetical protein